MKQTKHIKMLLIAVLALLLAIALVACNGDKKNNNDNNSNNNDNSFDDVSETELCVGTGGIWDYLTKDDLEFIYSFLYTETCRQPNCGGICLITKEEYNYDYQQFCWGHMYLFDEEPDLYTYGYYIFSSHENASKFVQELKTDSEYEAILRNNAVFIIDSNYPHIDEVREGNYNLDDLPGKQMKMINTMLMKNNIYQINVTFANEVYDENEPTAPKYPISAVGCEVRYYDNECSNCMIEEMKANYFGEYSDECIDRANQLFDQDYNDKIGIEYTEDSGCEVNKEEGNYHYKLKTKPGFRFKDILDENNQPTGKAAVFNYYYDSEDGLDVIIPAKTPDEKTVTEIDIKFDKSIKSITIPSEIKVIGSSAFDATFKNLQIYYCGTEEQWREIKLGSYNEPLENATIYYFSEQPNNDGQHWHWNAQNKPELWK